MLKDSANLLTGNDRYEGFGIDLIHELSLLLGFNYTFTLQEDKVYGSYNNETNQWNGMIRELRDFVSTCHRTEDNVELNKPNNPAR